MFKRVFLIVSFIYLSIIDIFIYINNIAFIHNLLLIPDIIVSIISIYFASDVFLDVASDFGNRISISSRSVGIFIVGFAAIFDEISMSLMAAIQGYGAISFGAIQGSNTISLLAFFIIIPLYFRSGISKFRTDAYLIIGSSLFLYILSIFFIKIPFYFGFITLVIFLIYMSRVRKEEDNGEIAEYSNTEYSYFFGLLSLFVIIVASYNMINSSTIISYIFGINNFLSSYILLGIFGSIPEISMMIISAAKNRKNISIGLITGSTLYKETFVFSLAAFTFELTFSGSYFSLILMIIFSIILFVYTLIFK